MYRFHSLRGLVGAAILVSASSGALAVPVAYDESTMGDLPVNGGPATELTLGIGANTITGQSHSFSQPDGSSDFDIDAVSLQLPPGMLVTGMHVDLHFTDTTANTSGWDDEWYVTSFLNGSSTQASTCFAVLNPTGSCSNSAPGGGPLVGAIPASATQYFIGETSDIQAMNWSKAYGGTMSYVLTIDVTAVPEPAAWMLIVTGGVFLRLRRRAVSQTL